MCIVIGKTITAEDQDREIWVTYNLAHVNDDKTGRNRTVGRTSTCRPFTRSLAAATSAMATGDVVNALNVGDDYEDKDRTDDEEDVEAT